MNKCSIHGTHKSFLKKVIDSKITLNKISQNKEFRNGQTVVKTGGKHHIHLHMKLRWDNQENSTCRKEYENYKQESSKNKSKNWAIEI